MKRLVIGITACLVLAGGAAPAWAQSRPLVTEDPETVPAGNILFEAGLDFLQDALFPVSGLSGDLWRIGTVGLSFGVSSIAEIQIDGGLRNRLAVKLADPAAPLAGLLDFEGESTSDFEYNVIGAKIRFMAETC